MQNFSQGSLTDVKVVNFATIPVDTSAQRFVYIKNTLDRPLTYKISSTYIVNSIDHVFNVSVPSYQVNPGNSAEVKITFKPNVVGQAFTEYYIIDDSDSNTYRLTVMGRCFGPEVSLNKRKLKFSVCKNVLEQRQQEITLINTSPVDTTYQWFVPPTGQGNFQISTGSCGLIRAFESITTSVIFTGLSLGVYTAELVCLVLNQEPLFINVYAVVMLPDNTVFNIDDHVFDKGWKRKGPSAHLLENSLSRLSYIPSASVIERYLDFGEGSVKDMTRNISQTLCVTNHEKEEGYIQWIPDPDNVFIIDPIACLIPSNESRLFTVRFRPKMTNEVFGYLMCGDYQFQSIVKDVRKLKHSWFRIPCIGNTWNHCTEWPTDWDCPIEVVMPPTVPTRTTFSNFMLSNRLDIPMHFKFEEPFGTNFVVMPMCGIVPSRGWQIITVALEPKSFGEYCENWDIIINRVQKARISLCGNADTSQIDVMSTNTEEEATYNFPPTITGCTNYITSYLHNVTRMEIHMRVLNTVPWLGADNCGNIVIQPKEIIRYHWWFFPKTPDKVYNTTVTCTCVCIVDGRPVGEPTEIYINLTGFSELPNLKMIPKHSNLYDVVVGESKNLTVSLLNNGICYFTSRLYYEIDGMGDDYIGDRCEIDSAVNSLKPSNLCEVTYTVTPGGAGSRQIDIKYTVLFRSEYDEIEEIQPIKEKIGTLWYDGIYPTFKIQRTISVTCPIILSNHCVWNITNVNAFNKALVDCRPYEPLEVNLYGPDLCIRPEGFVEVIFVMGSVYDAPVPWSLRREKICDCEIVEVQKGLSTFEMRHTCIHRPLVELSPLSGNVLKKKPEFLHLKFKYTMEGVNTLCYKLSLPNDRTIFLYINISANINTRGILKPLRRHINEANYLAVMNCGRVPINNLDPVIRLAWLYNPSNVFTTWRLLRGNLNSPDSAIRCLLFFAEVPPLGKLSIPFSFMPTEMVDYETIFACSFGYDTMKIKVTGQGGLPNCVETRLDIPSRVDRIILSMYRNNVVYLSKEHLTLPAIPTHSLTRDVISICNDTDHIMRFIWLPERIANMVNIVMTPCWGVVQPKSAEWITMTVYTLQEPSTFTTTVSCELLDLTERRRYQRNEMLRRQKQEKCRQEFIINEKGFFHPGINDSPPYVLDIEKPQPSYISMTVSVCSKGQRDGFPRFLLKQQWEQTPPYDLMSSNDDMRSSLGGNTLTVTDVMRIIDGILWDALHSKMFKHQLEFYSKEPIPTYTQLVNQLKEDVTSALSKRVTSGICDAIVNKAIFHSFGLNPKRDFSILEAV